MLQLYALKNIEDKYFGTPMYFHNDDHAKHDIAMWYTPERIENVNPQNFELWHIAEFEEGTGQMHPGNKDSSPIPTFIINCNDLLLKEEQNS